jgi:2-polyprenyl-6-methoxyphenol hydroxylase-like FAD-dependent oxidoreductase
MAGDAACFIDPVFSTGVHLASLAALLGARTIDDVLRGRRSEEAALEAYDRTYRGAFDRYLRFLYFFYDHNEDPDSYFWAARRILTHEPADLSLREAFVRLISGAGDWATVPAMVADAHERWGAAIRGKRAAALPGIDVLRVRNTLGLMRPAGSDDAGA